MNMFDKKIIFMWSLLEIILLRAMQVYKNITETGFNVRGNWRSRMYELLLLLYNMLESHCTSSVML
jgi:hypothetical protein